MCVCIEFVAVCVCMEFVAVCVFVGSLRQFVAFRGTVYNFLPLSCCLCCLSDVLQGSCSYTHLMLLPFDFGSFFPIFW